MVEKLYGVSLRYNKYNLAECPVLKETNKTFEVDTTNIYNFRLNSTVKKEIMRSSDVCFFYTKQEAIDFRKQKLIEDIEKLNKELSELEAKLKEEIK